MRTATSARRVLVVGTLVLAAGFPGTPAKSHPDEPPIPPGGDIPAAFKKATEAFDFTRREVMVPMRDGVKLYTLVLVPKGARGAPILMTRTPYRADNAASRNPSPRLQAALHSADDVVAASGYIRVFQDVRGKHKSEGDYVMNRPLRGALNPTAVDHSTDTWDTIDWLVKNTPESNGKVGLIGTSYPGFLVLMGLVNPHPALRAAVPVNPMVDVWIGDDWFHNGAFRQEMMDYVYVQTAAKDSDEKMGTGAYDDYDAFLSAGSAGEMGRRLAMDQLPFWRRLTEHPAYDDYWQRQAVDKLLSEQPLAVPTLYVASLWDQEDIYGAVAAYAATEPKDTGNDRNFLAIGPWPHGGSNGNGSSLGALRFADDTALYFRKSVLQPFLDQHLKDGAPKADTPPVLAYETGADVWRRYDSWPRSCARGCPSVPRVLYLGAGSRLGLAAPPSADPAYDEYVSDPAKPVPYRLRPNRPIYAPGSTWGQWLVDDQRNFSDRTDVLTYVTDVLQEPLAVAGQPTARLFASTSGTDSDWVVKLIDVYPDEVPAQAELGGYQLMVAAEIFRGRYRESLDRPRALTPDKVELYSFALPTAHHLFRAGHRLMVQVQSSWFPLYDRNPQTYVPNVFWAKTADYRKAVQRVYRAGDHASAIELPTVGSRPQP
jgi:putative CocE/NonD family hydrolase